MTGAYLNAVTGRLAVEGEADLEALRREGRKHGCAVSPVVRPGDEPTRTGADRVRWRAICSGAALFAAGAAQLVGVPAGVFIPLYLLAVVTGGWGYARRAYYSLPRLEFNIAALMTIAVCGAVAIGEWREAAVLAFLFSVSELLESWTAERTRRSIRELMDLAPRVARIRGPAGEIEVPVEELRVGDVVGVRPGERISVDGRVKSGESAVNQAPITGESLPVDKGPGAEVYAGTLNTFGYLEIEVSRTAGDNTIARIIHLVEEAQAGRAPHQAFVDRFAAVYTPAVLVLAAGVALLPPLLLAHDWQPWLYRGLVLLVVSCPCALVVSTPVSIVSAISNATRQGVLIKGGVHLEAAGTLDAVAFDKTGTLTRGVPAVTDVIPLNGYSEAELLRLAAGLETRSEHPLAAAVVAAAAARGVEPKAVADFSARPGRGALGMVDGRPAYVGNLRLFGELGVGTGPAERAAARLQAEGKTPVLVGWASALVGVIAVADTVRDGGLEAMRALKRAGVRRTVMLTGDNAAVARMAAARTGVDEFHADLLPQDKVAVVERLRRRYGRVAMVGDGINDAPALAAATVGIAMGGAGTDTTLETADIVLMGDDLSRLPFTIRLSRATLRVIRQNIGLSLGIKAAAILAVFPGFLTLWLAILADMGATLLVTANGMRLLRYYGNREAETRLVEEKSPPGRRMSL